MGDNVGGMISTVIGLGLFVTVVLPLIIDISDESSNSSNVSWFEDSVFDRTPTDPIVKLCVEHCLIYDYPYARSDSEGNCWCHGLAGEVFSGVVS